MEIHNLFIINIISFLYKWKSSKAVLIFNRKQAEETTEQEANVKTAGIIAEYNPFHNGHEYHIMQTRNITGADYVIAIMSGNYVQRGTPAVMDKKIRTKSALLGGADLVIELPLFAACSSAPDFAIGAVSLLHKLGVIDYLSFGSECQDINKLKQIASFLSNMKKKSSVVQKSL